MGLDWMPGRKPRAGREAELDQLRKSIARTFCWGRQRKEARIEEISVPPEETLGAPIVGTHAQATEWARSKFEHRKNSNLTMDEFLKELHGLPVIDLVRPCDGVPMYSNGGMGYIGPESFRAQCLKDCTEVIGQDAFDECFVEKNPQQCLAFATLLEQRAQAYASAHGLDPTRLGEPDDPDSPAFKLDVVLAAARWCRYWGNAGHGMVPWF